MFLFNNKALSQGKMVAISNIVNIKPAVMSDIKVTTLKYMDPLENLKMSFNFLHCHGKLFYNHGSNANFLT